MPSDATTRSHASFRATTSPIGPTTNAGVEPSWSIRWRTPGATSSASGVASGHSSGECAIAASLARCVRSPSPSRSAAASAASTDADGCTSRPCSMPREVVDAHTRQCRDLLAAQTRRSAASVVDQADVGRTQRFAARPQEHAEVGGVAHRSSVPHAAGLILAPALPGCLLPGSRSPERPGLPRRARWADHRRMTTTTTTHPSPRRRPLGRRPRPLVRRLLGPPSRRVQGPRSIQPLRRRRRHRRHARGHVRRPRPSTSRRSTPATPTATRTCSAPTSSTWRVARRSCSARRASPTPATTTPSTATSPSVTSPSRSRSRSSSAGSRSSPAARVTPASRRRRRSSARTSTSTSRCRRA